jgi:sulfate-transporting ATPase
MLYLQLAVVGLVAGAAYALSSLGLVAIFKGSGVINFGQGAVGMTGTYVYANWVIAGKNNWIGLALGVLTSAAVGLVVFLLVMRPLRRRPPVVRMVASLGVLLVLEGFADLRWSPNPVHVPYLITEHEYSLGSITIGSADILSIALALVVGAVLAWYFARTTLGRAAQASAASEETVQRLGYPSDVLGALTWIIGSALAGLGGILIAPSIGLTQTILTLIMIEALSAALAGGFKSLGITVAAAFIIGCVESILTGQLSSFPGWSQAVPFFAVVIILLVRGKGVPSRDAVGVERLPAAPFPRVSLRWGIAVVLLLGAGPALLSAYWLSVAAIGTGLALVTLSVVVVTGFAGQVSLAQWGIAGVGAFTAADLAGNHGWPLIPALLAAVVTGGATGLIVSLPALRIRGIDLAVVTLGAGVALQNMVLDTVWGTTGVDASPPTLFGVVLSGRAYLYLAEAILVLVAVGVWTIRRSSVGQRLVAVRGSERAAAASGVRSWAVKVTAFAGAAAVAGLGGGIWAFSALSIQSSSFDPITSISLLAFAFICGVGSVGAGVVCGFFVGLAPVFFTNILHISGNAWFDVIGGLGVILTLLQHPDGIYVRDRRNKGRGQRRAIASRIWSARPVLTGSGRGRGAELTSPDRRGSVAGEEAA